VRFKGLKPLKRHESMLHCHMAFCRMTMQYPRQKDVNDMSKDDEKKLEVEEAEKTWEQLVEEQKNVMEKPDVLPNEKAYNTSQLPPELIKDWCLDIEKFKELWASSQDFDLQRACIIPMSFDEPFLGSLSRRILKIKTAAIPTVGVRINGMGLEMLWNPIFFKHKLHAISPKHCYGVYKHELYHIVCEHITNRRQTPHILWNVATDCAINSLIPRDELPAFGCHPGELYVPPNAPPEWKPGVLSLLIKSLPKGKSSEWYMNTFLDDKGVQEAMQRAAEKAEKRKQKRQQGGQKGKGMSDPNSDPSEGQPGSGEGGDPDQNAQDPGEPNGIDRDLENALNEELFGEGSGASFDDHDAWDQMSDSQRDMMRDAIRDVFRDCVKETESKSKGWGSVPSSMVAAIKKLISKEVDWRALLNQFIGRTRTSQTTSSIKRVNRRVPWDFPGRKRAYSARPGILFDQSGSMDDEWVSLFFAELDALGNLSEYEIIPFDYDVDEKNIQNIKRGQKPNTIRTKCGGTNFEAAVQYGNKHADRLDALIMLTDGGCSAPSKSALPLAYVLAPGCELMFDPGPNTTVIKMTDTRKRR